MKTQISRYRRESVDRYDAVHQQQGRVLTDADWNALVDALRRTLVEGNRQALGSGMPTRGGLLNLKQDNSPELQWGRVVVDGRVGEWVPTSETDEGVGEGADPLAVQADLPGLSPPPDDHVLYVDLWEREITALEDPSLADPALNGADTCSRTRTMVQIKWAPLDGNGGDPLDESRLPACGNAPLTIQERKESTIIDDPCDPQVEVFHQGLGDSLFRLEVHAHPGTEGGDLVLKWSRENGAEAEARDLLPPGFVSPDYVYEPFGSDSECHLGIHLHDSAGIPRRGSLVAGRAPHEEDDTELPWLRRWDGYCQLKRSGDDWEWQGGWHRGTALRLHESVDDATQAGSAEIHLNNDRLRLLLDRYSLELELSGRRFVSGDFWLATLREAAEKEARIELVSETPVGIHHHYLRLYRVLGGKPEPLDDATRRRFQCLDLASLLADRVGYDTGVELERWNALLAPGGGEPPENVQQALDALLAHLNSGSVVHHFVKCDRKPHIRSLMVDAGLVHWDKSHQPLDTLLNDLICRLDARTLPYRARTSSTTPPQSLDDVILDRTKGGKVEGDLHLTKGLTIDGGLNVAKDIRGGTVVKAPFLHGDKVVAEESLVYPRGAKEGHVLTAKDQLGNAVWAKPQGGSGDSQWQPDDKGFLVPRDEIEGVRAVPELATGEHRGGWVTGVAWQDIEPSPIGGDDFPAEFDPVNEDRNAVEWVLKDEIQKQAREILLHVSAMVWASHPMTHEPDAPRELTLVVSTWGTHKQVYRKYLYLAFGAGFSSVSENIWLPIGQGGLVALEARLGEVANFDVQRLTCRALLTGFR